MAPVLVTQQTAVKTPHKLNDVANKGMVASDHALP